MKNKKIIETVDFVFDEEFVKEFLIDEGMNPNNPGFKYLLESVEMISKIKIKKEKYSMRTDIFPVIANNNGTTSIAVQRAIEKEISNSNAFECTLKGFIDFCVLKSM